MMDGSTFVYLFMILTLVVTGVLLYLVPIVSPPDTFFAITVAPGFREKDDARAVLRSYRRWLWLGTLAGIVAVLAWSGSVLAFVAATALQAAAAVAAFVSGRRRVRPHAVSPTTAREATLAVRELRWPGGATFAALPFVLLAVVAAWLGARWDDIPARFPIHWDQAGRPDGWATRTVAGVLAPLGLATASCAILLVLGWYVAMRTRRVHAAGAAGAREEARRRLHLVLLNGLAVVIAANGASTAVLPLVGSPTPAGVLGMALLPLALVLVIAFALVRLGREPAPPPTPAEPEMFASAFVGDRTPDRCWKWGLIYYNPDDPAFLVEKRFGIGYTFNFARAWSWVLMAALLALLLVLMQLGRSH
jgi:uncharacterized membrane protein